MHLLIQMGISNIRKDFKIQCVEAVLKGESSVLDVVSQYQISSSHMLREWISLYNANRELKELYSEKGGLYGRRHEEKQPLKERKEIVDTVLITTVTIKELQAFIMSHTVKFIPG